MYLLNRFSKADTEITVPLPEAKRDVRLRLYLKLMLLDCTIIGSVFLTVSTLFGKQWMALDKINLMAMVIPIYVGVAINGNAYSRRSLERPFPAAAQAALNLLLAMLAIQCVLYFAQISDSISRFSFGLAIAISAALLAALRRPFSRYAKRRTGGQLTDDLIITDGVILGDHAITNIADAAMHNLQPNLHDPQMLNRLGRWMRSFDRVVIACPPERRHAWTIILQGAAVQGEIMLTDGRKSGAIGLGECLSHDTHIVSKGPLSVSSRMQKRMFDLALTIPAVLFLAPLLICVAIAIKLDSRGPILFLQDRIGLGNRLFKIAKFRSMRVEQADSDGTISASRSDDRITRVGRFIRRTSIDELPQLFNVLMGDMSIVGPRPHALGSKAASKLFWEVSHDYWRRHALKPGMTGLAQIRGFRGATDREEDLENRLTADLEYLKDWSLVGELMIILQTFKVLVHRNAF
ncbi:sugar transferase [Sphingobium sp.]|uniref:sugar transferase n=1 Tax=Sphingobium sp. TaxID=1912891 RepID=UPI003B3B3211